ncbi:MAG: lipid A deacylase LpxR family protein [Pseudomonadota bacterium]
MRSIFTAIAGTAIGLLVASAAAVAEEPAVLSLIGENDIFGGTDQGYTNGLKVSYLSPEGKGRRLARLLLGAREQDAVRFGVAAGQSIFTPDDIDVAEPLPNQNPYAGWLYLEATSLVEREGGPIDILRIEAGVVGPAALAEDAQRTWHRIINARDILGWDNQLRNEPAFAVSLDRIWRPLRPGRGLAADILPHLGASAGTVLTEARGGATIRIGNNLGEDALPARIAPDIPAAGFHSAQGFTWQIFAGAEARGVAHRIFLDGNTFRDSQSVQKKNFIGEFQAGFAFQSGGYSLAYTHVFRSKEYEGQDDRIDFGAVTLSAAF